MADAIGVLTSGGDAQGMNAALRAVVRTAINRGIAVYAIYEGYQGMVEGGERIRRLQWGDVGGIMQQGGTVIGTARSADFRTREGRRKAAANLIECGIDRLVVIGGDGSLTGANTFRQEWGELLAELVASGQITPEAASNHPYLGIVGLVGSIDNDFSGTDMTIGADTALHRITEAIDAISSTAASHQRSFVVEVMGRHCGYLALMSAIAGGADWVLIPENPPMDGWEERMCSLIHTGRDAGRRENIVVIAEGAIDRHGNEISSDYVKRLLEERLGEDTRVTILGHVQRGGVPSAFDRWMSSLLGYAAVEDLLSSGPESEPQLIGLHNNRIVRTPLMKCVEDTRAVAKAIAERNYPHAMELRGSSFIEMYQTFQAMAQAVPSVTRPIRRRRIAVFNVGGPAPGMNTAVRAAVRQGLDKGYVMLGVRNGFKGLIKGTIEELSWGDVEGWGPMGGSELGTNRKLPDVNELAEIARTIEANQIEALLVIGGMTGYSGTHKLLHSRTVYPAFNIPTICIPCSINNNLPGSEMSIGADTALNAIIDALDKIKQSAVASRRCFVVEVMGRHCGYLALLSGLATGAERIYLPEEGIKLSDLQEALANMSEGFSHGKRLSLIIRNECANPLYTTAFMCALFEEEGGGLFDVRQAILGHIQQGGSPSPYDRIQAMRLASRSIAFLSNEFAQGTSAAAMIGIRDGKVRTLPLDQFPDLLDSEYRRPKEQWWMSLRPIAKDLARPRL